MTKAELIKALDGLPNDTQISVCYDHYIYDDLAVDVFTDGEDDTIVELAHINIYDTDTDVKMPCDDLERMQQALMLAEMFFIAVPASQGSGINPLGKVLSEAIGITRAYID